MMQNLQGGTLKQLGSLAGKSYVITGVIGESKLEPFVLDRTVANNLWNLQEKETDCIRSLKSWKY